MTGFNRFSKSYRNWIYSEFDSNADFTELFDHLYETEFVYVLPRDENRAVDGQYLRYQFAESHGMECDPPWDSWPASVLEVLVSLAFSIENTRMFDCSTGSRASEWFWEMMENLGLDLYSDGSYNEDQVDRIIHIFMYREYTKDGIGSPFPVPGEHDFDMRETEIWYQIDAYFGDRI